ncbi:MAG TPA: sulfatase [Solirubrobacterales bacterium]|nr:sulfatase [Solirubrobacterales bacterium]
MIVILTDDQDVASLSVMRHVRDELAKEGTTFGNSFATVPECCPSRVTLLTGQFAHNHGVLSNEPPDGGFDAFEDDNYLPIWLEQAGYRTGYIGKYLNGYGFVPLGNDPRYVPPGWTDWRVLTNHTEYQEYGYTLNENGDLRSYGDEPRDYQTDVVARKSAQFVRKSLADRHPFFVTVAPVAPHDEGAFENDPTAPRNPRPAPRDAGRFSGRPLPRPPSFNEANVEDKPESTKRRPLLRGDEIRELTRLYRSRLESLLSVDDLVNRLVTVLRRNGALNRTMIVFTSDNGFLLGEHRRVGKEVVYEESVRVPLVIRGPGFPRGVTRRQLVGNVDLVPTILALTGAEPGLTMDGVSLLPLARRPHARADRAMLLEVLSGRTFSAIRTRRYVFSLNGEGVNELYDLERDPFELKNVARAPGYAEIKGRLRARLVRLRDCAGQDCR